MSTQLRSAGEDAVANLVSLMKILEPPTFAVEPLAEHSDIYRFRFASTDQCDRLVSVLEQLQYADSQLSGSSSEEYRTSRDVFLEELDKEAYQAFHAFALPLLKKVTDVVWGWECNTLTDVSIVEYRPGSYFKEHVDAAESEFHSLRHISFIVYLSDAFEGGETAFRRQSVYVPPMRGWGIVFPSGITHPHESKIVRSGVKYAIVGWLTRRVK
jgi:predicted 2-oxoglutarate/Fe(II)-dependent dioxygenase YbiX